MRFQILSAGFMVFLCLSGWPVYALDKPGGNAGAMISMDFSMEGERYELYGVKLSTRLLEEKVRKNLSEWRYPLQQGGQYSHRLQASVGQIEHRATPVGFSFSNGNSDPRSGDFQKADVLPITCKLSKFDSPQPMAERAATFSVHSLSPDAGESKLLEDLADRISTACFNLLQEQKFPAEGNRIDPIAVKPVWAPEIRMEVIPAPAIGIEKNSVEGDAESTAEERKQIIIHNQGTPLIIKFGHERQ